MRPRDSPYFGLDYFDEQWGAWFFGRENECDTIITNLRAARLTLLHADSGVGKSSLLRAGVAYRMARAAREQFERRRTPRYIPVVFKAWKDEPVVELVSAIEQAIEPFLGERPKPELSRERLDEAIHTAASALGTRLLIVLDQFEEYFVYSSGESTPERFADELARCVNSDDLPANFLIAIREDAYAGLGDLFKGRITNVYGNYLEVQYLARGAAEDAIRKPIEVYNQMPGIEPVEIEPRLIDAVLEQVRAPGAGDSSPAAGSANGDGRIATPLLQLVMETVWERERTEGSRVLRLATLEQLEGAEKIVDTHLEAALQGLAEDEREVAIDLFDHLVTPSGGKIAESIPDLAKRTGRDEAQVGEVLAKLDRARIVTSVKPPPGRDLRFRRYEIYHDVLAPAINRTIGSREEERLEREKAAAHERARIERERARRFRRLARIAFGLLIFAAIVCAFALFELQKADSAKHAAQSEQAAANAERVSGADPQLATLLAREALKLSDTPHAELALRDALPQVQLERTLTVKLPAIAASFSPDGSEIAAADDHGTIGLWSASSHKLIGTLGTQGYAGLISSAFSRDGKRLATAYGDGTIRIWDLKHRRVERSLTVAQGAAAGVAFNPDGTRIVTAGTDGRIQFQDIASGALVGTTITEPSGQPFTDVAWSPDGKRIVTANQDGTASVWDGVPRNPRGRYLETSQAQMNSARFSRDGKLIVTAGGDDTARVFAVRGDYPLQATLSGNAPINRAVFSPDGHFVATANADGTVGIWDAAGTISSTLALLAPKGTTTPLDTSFSPSGKQLVVAAGDGSVRVWNTAARSPSSWNSKTPIELTVPWPPNPVNAAALTSDGQYVVTGSSGGNARVFSAKDGRPVRDVTIPNFFDVTWVAPSARTGHFLTADGSGSGYEWDVRSGQITGEFHEPSGQTLNSIQARPGDPARVLTASSDGTARIWSAKSNPGHSIRVLRPAGAQAVFDASFSPDGLRVVTAEGDGTARIWDANTGRVIGGALREPSASGASDNTAAFSASGRLVVTASSDGSARVWDARTGKEIGQPILEPGGANPIAARFGESDRVILTAGSDGVARLWDVQTGRQLLALAGHSAAINAAVFTPDYSQIVTASGDGTAAVWNARLPGQQGAPLTEPNGAVLNTASFDSAAKRVVTASDDGTARIWDASTQRQVGKPIAEPAKASIISAAFSAAGDQIVTASSDGTARTWSSSGRQLAKFGNPGGAGLVSALLSPNAHRMLTVGNASNAGVARLWDLTSHKPVGQPITDPLGATFDGGAFSPDGSLIVTPDTSGTAYLWHATPSGDGSYRQVGFPLTEPGLAAFNSARFSTDGGYIVTGSDDGTARVWNVATSSLKASVTMPDRSQVHNAVLGPNGWLLTASGDGFARIWDWKSGRLLTTFDVGDQLNDAEFSADGRFVVAADHGGTAHIFSTQLADPKIAHIEAIAKARVPRSLTQAERQKYLGG